MSRTTHHRVRDHHGADVETSIELSDVLGQYPAGTSLRTVLIDLYTRLVAVEGRSGISTFTASAVIRSPRAASLQAGGIIRAERTGTVTLDAVIA